jgi:hypothetical protein
MSTGNGRSGRTQNKIYLIMLLAMYLTEKTKRDGKRLVIVDVTGGDGDWSEHLHSSEVFVSMAAEGITVDINLVERQRSTYNRLIVNMSNNLQALGWIEDSPYQWSLGKSRITCWYGDGNDALRHIPITSGDRLFLIHDPNTIEDWVLAPSRKALGTLPTQGKDGNIALQREVVRKQGFWDHIPTRDVTIIHSLGRPPGPMKPYHTRQARAGTFSKGSRIGKNYGWITGRAVWNMHFVHILRWVASEDHDTLLIYLPARRGMLTWAYVVVSEPGIWQTEIPGIFEDDDYEMAWAKEDITQFTLLREKFVGPVK